MILGERHPIVVVEDAAVFGDPIARILQATRFVGILSVDADEIVAIRPGPNATPTEDFFDSEPNRLCRIQTKSVRVAFLDGGLVRGSMKGRDIALLMAPLGIKIVAITGSGAGNPPLLKAGALMGLPKELVVRAVQAGVLVPKNIMHDASATAARLDTLVLELNQERWQAHKSGQQFDFGFDVSPMERGVT